MGTDAKFESLIQITKDMVSNIRDGLSFGMDEKVKVSVEAALAGLGKDAVIKQMTAKIIPSISWNHAKIVAVDGQTVMTGGGIFLSDYMDGHYQISDLQSKVKGEAAISAHHYFDYFWEYASKLFIGLRSCSHFEQIPEP